MGYLPEQPPLYPEMTVQEYLDFAAELKGVKKAQRREQVQQAYEMWQRARAAMDVADVHGVSHITGGGFYENIPRCIPDGLCAKIDKSALRTPPIFSMLQRMGSIPEHDMFNTYNMGVGMTMIVAKDDADKALATLKENGQDAYVIGEVVSGEEKVALC